MIIKYITNVRIPTSRAQGYAIMKMCEEFSKTGNEVELIVPSRRNTESSADSFSYYGINFRFPIRKIKSIDFLGRSERFGRLFYWTDMISFLLSILFSCPVKKGDVIYTRDYLVPLVFSRNKFICLEVHDMPARSFLFRYLIKKPKLFFVLNNSLKKELISVGVSPDKIFISPSGVDISDFDISIKKDDARKDVGLPLDKNIIMYTGHLYPWKGTDVLAEAAKLMPENVFVFVGGVEPDISSFKDKYKGFKNITTVPFLERNKIPIYLKAADVLVIPNSAKSVISSKYTSPLKMFEYMASKRPIIASDLSSIRETLGVENCIFAEADNPKSFAEAIKKLIYNTEFGNSLADKAFERVQSFSWEKRAKNILNFIQHENTHK